MSFFVKYAPSGPTVSMLVTGEEGRSGEDRVSNTWVRFPDDSNFLTLPTAIQNASYFVEEVIGLDPSVRVCLEVLHIPLLRRIGPV